MRVGIVGSGNMAAVHQGGWSASEIQIAAVFGPHAESAARLGAECGAVVCSSYEELLGLVDVVDICTPTHTHSQYALAAAAGACCL